MSKVGVHKIPNGSLEVLADGTKIQKTNDGNKLVVHPDGTKVQTTKDVSRTMWGLVERTGRRTHTKERPCGHILHSTHAATVPLSTPCARNGRARTDAYTSVPPHIPPPCANPLPTCSAVADG